MNLEAKVSNKSIWNQTWLYFVIIVIISGLLGGILVFLSPQTSGFQYFILFTSIFLFCNLVLLLTLPKTNTVVISLFNDKKIVVFSILSFVLLFPLLNWIYVDDVGESITFFVIWYLIPVGILTIPICFTQKKLKLKALQPLMHVVGVIYLAIGFDNRYTYKVIAGLEDIGYNFNALWVSTLILVILSIQIEDFIDYFSWKLTRKNLLLCLIILLILSILIIPAGLISGFIQWNPSFTSLWMQPLIFLGIWFTIALPEELIARGVIQHQSLKLSRIKPKKSINWQIIVIIIIASVIFGLSHWNNINTEFVWYYITFATIAGIGYGICWFYGGLFPAMLAHTLVDWLWQLLLAS